MEQGYNGPVSDAMDRLEKHLNKTAHGGGRMKVEQKRDHRNAGEKEDTDER